ncbi:MAG: DUF4276 family protein [Planctomycetes bacterium]|nr:DUF4276 family protein [Planctomycetota bacterium]
MSRLRVASIVEGHGEVSSVPILLDRIWREVIHGEYVDILRPPIRQPRDRLAHNKNDALVKAVGLAAAKLNAAAESEDPEVILVLIDADKDLPCVLGPQLLRIAQDARKDKAIACVTANVEYETWFAAAAGSLTEYLDLSEDEQLPTDPEARRLGKGWIERRFKGVKYSETVDQPRLTAKMDLRDCRQHSPSFDKLCRELERFR